MLSLIVAAAAVAAFTPLHINASAAEMNCRVPFNFIVSGATLPAGTYLIGSSDGLLMVSGHGKSAFVMGRPVSGSEDKSGHGKVVFLKSGPRYYLIEVWRADGTGHEIGLSHRQVEERARAANAPVERIVIPAM
jgi:hypothetical protein